MNFLDQHKACSASVGYVVNSFDNSHLCKDTNKPCSVVNCKLADDRALVPFSGGLIRARGEQ